MAATFAHMTFTLLGNVVVIEAVSNSGDWGVDCAMQHREEREEKLRHEQMLW